MAENDATDAASCEGACSEHAACRNDNKPSPMLFLRVWSYIQPASQQHETAAAQDVHTLLLHLKDLLRPADQPMQPFVCASKEFLLKLLQSV